MSPIVMGCPPYGRIVPGRQPEVSWQANTEIGFHAVTARFSSIIKVVKGESVCVVGERNIREV